jgi:hypothetical protein
MTLSLAHQNVKEKENRKEIKKEGEHKKINISKNKKNQTRKEDKKRVTTRRTFSTMIY